MEPQIDQDPHRQAEQPAEYYETYDDIRGRIAELAHKLDETGEKFYAVLQEMSPETQKKFEEGLEKKYGEWADVECTPSEKETQEAIRAVSLATFDDNEIIKILPALNERATVIDQLTEIEPRARALTMERVASDRRFFAGSVDWDEIIEKNVDSGLYTEDIHQLFYGLRRINSNSLGKVMTIDIGDMITKLEKWREKLSKDGYILEKNKAQITTEEWLASGNLIQAIDDWYSLTRKAIGYLSHRRRKIATEDLPDLEVISKLKNLAHHAGLNGRDQQNSMPAVVVDAIERKTARVLVDFDIRDEERLKKDLETRPNSLFIGSLNLFTEATGIDDASDWVHDRVDRLPDWFTEGLGFIIFANDVEMEDAKRHNLTFGEKVQSKGRFVAGTTATSENTVIIDVRKESSKFAIEKHKHLEIGETLDHELMHYAHNNRLPISWLRRWQEVIENNPVNVSSYVEHTRLEKKSENTINREDLAVSFSYYMNLPAILYMKDVARFDILNQLFKKYSPTSVDYIRSKAEEYSKLP